MPAYRYRAVHASGRIQRGRMTAANENELGHYLSESGLELIEAREQKTAAPRARFQERPSRLSLAVALGQLEDLLRANVPFIEALAFVIDTLPSGILRDRLGNIHRDIHHGSTIAGAFRRQSPAFGPVFLSTLEAGEATGDMATTFGQLAMEERRQERLQTQLRRALRYPLFLLALALGVTAFMMTMVVPPLVSFLMSIEGQLPGPTRFLIATSHAFVSWWWVALAGGFTSATIVLLGRHGSESFARRTDGWLLNLPVCGPVWRKLAIARFAHSFALLLQSGVALPESLRLASSVLGNRALIALADRATENVLAGQPLSLAATVLFPRFVTQMLRVGEQSGQLVKALDNVTNYYDAEAQTTVESLIGSLEPALTLLVGALLAWIVLAVLGPVYGSLSQMQGAAL